MGRIARGFGLLGASGRVLLRHPRILVVPAGALVVAALLGAGACAIDVVTTPANALLADMPLVAALLLIGVTSVLANALMVAAAADAITGGSVRLGGAMGVVWRRRWALVGWSVITGVAAVLARGTAARGGVMRWVGGAVAVGWGLITYLVVPVILFEGGGPVGSIRRASQLYRQRWGEEITGSYGIGLAVALITTALILLTAVLFVVTPWALVGGAALLVLLLVVGSALVNTFTAALYLSAAGGQAPDGFGVLTPQPTGPAPMIPVPPSGSGGFPRPAMPPGYAPIRPDPFCGSCGTLLAGHQNFCVACGTPRPSATGLTPVISGAVTAEPWHPHHN